MIITSYQPGPVPEIEDWSWEQDTASKPEGLWFSPHEPDEDYSAPVNAWKAWCQYNGVSREYTHQYRLDNMPLCTFEEFCNLMCKKKVLVLRTVKEIEDFSWKFRGRSEYEIRWGCVRTMARGIYIPYQPSLRHNPMYRWYNVWDLSSGCIWERPLDMDWNEVSCDWDGSV